MLTDVQALQTSGPAGARSSRRCQLTSLCCQQLRAQPVPGQLPPLPDPSGTGRLQAPARRWQMPRGWHCCIGGVGGVYGGVGEIFQAGCLGPEKMG